MYAHAVTIPMMAGSTPVTAYALNTPIGFRPSFSAVDRLRAVNNTEHDQRSANHESQASDELMMITLAIDLPHGQHGSRAIRHLAGIACGGAAAILLEH